MKLLKKINRQYIIASLGVLVFGIIGLYIILILLSSHEMKESLYSSKDRIVKHLEQHGTYPDLYPLVEVKEVPGIKAAEFNDTILYDAVEAEFEVFRQLITFETIGGKTFQISVRTMVLEKKDIYLTIFLVFAAVLALLLLILYLLNKKTAYDVWGAFYRNLKIIKTFSLQDNKPVRLLESGIQEFDELKAVIEQLSQKLTDDYNNLKQFSENAAHELQTPLSVIRSKLEVLQNNKNLTEEQSGMIQTIYQTVNRLRKLNQSLLLLTKIENRQYHLKESVSLDKMIIDTLDQLEEIISMKNLNLNTDLQSHINIKTDPYLAQMLIENLLSNAVKYTQTGGKIEVKFSESSLRIANSGIARLKNSDRIFDRFVKENQSDSSIGLGLAIAQKICAVNQFRISYDYAGGQHVFTVLFSPSEGPAG